jgi:hypothetical protein
VYVDRARRKAQRFLSEFTGWNTEKPQSKPQLGPESVATDFAVIALRPNFRQTVIAAFALFNQINAAQINPQSIVAPDPLD